MNQSQIKRLPRALPYAQAAREFHTTAQAIAEIASKVRGVIAKRGPHQGKRVKIERMFIRLESTGEKFFLASSRDVRRAKRAGVLPAAKRGA